MAITTLLFSLACIIAGTFLAFFQPDSPLPMILFGMAGAGGAGTAFVFKSQRDHERQTAEQEAAAKIIAQEMHRKEQLRADRLQEETTILKKGQF